MSPEEIVKVIKKKASRGVGIKRAKKLRTAAVNTVSVKYGLDMAALELKNLLNQYELLNDQLVDLEEKVVKMLEEILGA